MIIYKINLNGGRNIWRIRQAKDIYHCERLWRDGKYVGPKGKFKICRTGILRAKIRVV